MATLANQTISSTYDGLIKTSTDQPVPISGVQLLEDGVGNSLALSVGRANQGVTVTGTLSATSITGVLADGVTATTQTLGDNSTKVATTAYVDAQVTASDLDFAGDTGTGAVDLDSQTFTIAGTANEIETVASGQTVTIGLPNNVTIAGNLTVDTNTLYVDATNNRVGVGTTSFVSGEVLRVSGAISLPNNTPILLQDSVGNNRNAFNLSTSDILQIGAAGSGITAQTFHTSGSERLRIDSAGNVGIGTSSPSKKLEISGDRDAVIRLTNTRTVESSGNNIGTIEFYGNDSSGQGAGVRSAIRATTAGAGNESILTFSTANGTTNDVERMRIDSAGNVGIGGAPDNLFHVNGGSTYPIVKINASALTSRSLYLGMDDAVSHYINAQGSGSNLILKTESVERMRITSNGTITTSGTISSTADINTTGVISVGSGIISSVIGKRQVTRVVSGHGGANIFATTFGASTPQVGHLYVTESGTSNYLIATLFKQDSTTGVVTNVIANSGITVLATNSGGTIALTGYTVSANVRMKSVIEEC